MTYTRAPILETLASFVSSIGSGMPWNGYVHTRSAALTEVWYEKKKENFSFVGCCHRTSPATELLLAFLAWRDIGIVSQMTIAYPLGGGN